MYFTIKLDKDRMLCLAPLTDRQIAAAEPLDRIDGYFLFEQGGTGDFADIEIIAHVPTESAVLRLRAMLGMT
jgi:hypothetical protein